MPASSSIAPSEFSLLCDVIAAVGRAHRLSPDEAEDFAQTAHLKLLERNYAPLAQFTGRSTLRTYLTVVVTRLLLDWRNSRYGKWRPSAWARRHGTTAIQLDRLVTRDGHSPQEAMSILEHRPQPPESAALRDLLENLPRRSRARLVSADDLEERAIGMFEDPVEQAQIAASRQRAVKRLARAYRRLEPADRRLIHLRFERGLQVSQIAVSLGVQAKPLYARIHRILELLRRAVASESDTRSVAGRMGNTDLQTT